MESATSTAVADDADAFLKEADVKVVVPKMEEPEDADDLVSTSALFTSALLSSYLFYLFTSFHCIFFYLLLYFLNIHCDANVNLGFKHTLFTQTNNLPNACFVAGSNVK